MAKVPFGVALISILEGLVSIGVILAGLVTIATTRPILSGALGIVFLAIGLVGLGIAYGIWNGITVIWYVAVIFEVLSIISELFNLGTLWLGALIDVAILVYLLMPKTRDYFDVK